MKRIFILFFILNLLNVNGQDIDSLNAEALKLPTDTDRVDLFYNEGFANRSVNVQYSYDCAKQAERLAQQTSLPFYIAKAGNLLGILFYRKGDLPTALLYHKKALNLRTLINDKKGIALSQVNLGNIYSDLGQYKLAEKAYLKALEINTALNLPVQIDNCLLNLGVLSTELNMINVAENYFNRALSNAKKRSDYEIESACLNNLAELNSIRKNYDAAIANSLNSIKIKDLMDNEMEMADSYLIIANAYLQKNEAANALENLKIADSIILKFDYISARVHALKAYSDYYKLERNFEQALISLNLANTLKDSLEKVNKEIDLENTFIETQIMTETNAPKNNLLFIFSAGLLFMSILLFVYILKFKR